MHLSLVPVFAISFFLAFRTCNLVSGAWREGVGGFANAAWNERELIHYLRDAPPRGPLYSNRPDAICMLTGLDARWSPSRGESTEGFGELLAGQRGYLVWFDRMSSTWSTPLETILDSIQLREVTRTPDGAIYRHSD